MGGFAGYYGQTSLHPLALSAIIFLSLAVLIVPRRFSLVPLLLAATTIPMAQRLVVSGADFTLLRLLLLAYLIRIILRGEWRDFSWNKIDSAVLLWAVSGTIIMTVHYGDVSALINRLGWSYDILLTYFAARCLLRSVDDLKMLSVFTALISFPMAAMFFVEWTTRNNIFSVFGGVPSITGIREGRLRCQGPFAHPILAGTFWAALLPIIWLQLKEGHFNRWLGYAGTGAALFIVIASSSSTPILSVVAAFVGLAIFLFRRRRTQIWVGVIVIAALLHFVVMNNPIWHLMARVDIIGGSTGWHRFVIFDAFVNNFSEWFLTGESDPRSWGVWQMRDITNQYILEGLRGGLLTLIIFIALLVRCFGGVGRTLTLLEERCIREDLRHEWFVWMVGVGIFVHVVTFFGVSYFGQMIAILYLQLALAGSIYAIFQSGHVAGGVIAAKKGIHKGAARSVGSSAG